MPPVEEPPGALFLLDGMSLAFRAFFALPDTLATTSGEVTNALNGFVGMLVYILKEHQPGALAVAFDLPGETFRDAMVEDYKGGRADTPDTLPPQFDMIREVMAALAIPVIGAPGLRPMTCSAPWPPRPGTGSATWWWSPVTGTASNSLRIPTSRALQPARRERLLPLRRGGHH